MERGRDVRTLGVIRMLKIAGLTAAAVLFVACTAIPAQADCPDGYCPNGTVLPGTPPRPRVDEAQRQRAQCHARCDAQCARRHDRQCMQCQWKCDHPSH
jgi:hypothetical protein